MINLNLIKTIKSRCDSGFSLKKNAVSVLFPVDMNMQLNACSLRQRLKSLSGWRWRSQLVVVGASTAPPRPKGFTGAGELDKAGFKVEIKQKNLPGRNPALTRQKNQNPILPFGWKL